MIEDMKCVYGCGNTVTTKPAVQYPGREDKVDIHCPVHGYICTGTILTRWQIFVANVKMLFQRSRG